MNVLFFGSSSFSVPALKSVKSSVTHVVTKKTKPKGRGYLLEDNEVKQTALSLNLPVIEIESFRDEEARDLEELKTALFVVASFGLIIPKWCLALPSIGAINVHPSLLPKYRGPSPIQWAIWNGESETGITIIKMNERMDAGDILYQETVAIGPEDDAGTLSDRLSHRVAEILPDILEDVRINGMERGVQQEEADATYTPMINKEMGKLEWHAGSMEIARQVRALVTWPTAYTSLDDKMLKIFKVKIVALTQPGENEPGTIIAVEKEGVKVATGDGSVIVQELQLQNKKRMGAADFARGYKGLTGKRLK